MFDTARFKEQYIRNHEWVKRLTKGTDIEDISKAIRERIEFPAQTGPYIQDNKGESPTDIIDAIIEDEPKLRPKIEKATGLLIYKMMHGELGEGYKLLQGVFAIIRNGKFFECRILVHKWLKANAGILVKKNDSTRFYEATILDQKRSSYKDALLTFANIQEKDAEIEHWWFNLWREGETYWQGAAFIGLRKQNPHLACQEIELLMERKILGTHNLLTGCWRDLDAKYYLVETLRKGLDDTKQWAGLAMNTALEKMFPMEKDAFLATMKSIPTNVQ